MKLKLTITKLQKEAAQFAEIETIYDEPSLYGVTDGKAVGTYLEPVVSGLFDGRRRQRQF